MDSVIKNGILKSLVGFPRTLLITAASMQSDTAEIVQLAAVVAGKQNNAASQERRTHNVTNWQTNSEARAVVEQFAKESMDPQLSKERHELASRPSS